jgi:Type I phosphodiesterase / nucleotide pyrophosphatase
MAKKLVLAVVDSLSTDMLTRAVDEGEAPNFGALLDAGVLVPDCASSFPSVTPVACASIVTGVGPGGHWVPAMNWFHRGERRYVEYGSSLAATRTFGIVRTLYDTVYNMNLAHLNPAIATIFERLEDAGLRTACTPFLIFRGRTRHEVALEGVLRRVAQAATFRHAVYGPNELFYGELYASRRVPCAPTLARPGTRDDYSGCVAAELVMDDLFDFLLLSLPDNDHHSHNHGPEAMVTSIAHADRNFGRVVEAAGGLDEFLDGHAVLLMADHSQMKIDTALDVIQALGSIWTVLQPWSETPQLADLAVSPSARAASVYLLRDAERLRSPVRDALEELEGVELVAWREEGAEQATVKSAGGELRFRPGDDVEDARGLGWNLEGEPGAIGAEVAAGRFAAPDYPDALFRLWSVLQAPGRGDFVVSAAPGYECVDWGGATHVGGGSHGSLRREDSTGPMLFVGCGPDSAEEREQWSVRDAASVVLEHFGLDAPASGDVSS